MFYSKNMQEEELFHLSFSHFKMNNLIPSLSHSGLASGHLGFYQLLQKEWKPKYSESPLKSVSEIGLICLLTPQTSKNTAI